MLTRSSLFLPCLGMFLAFAIAGCFAPPTAEPLDDSKVSTVIPLPYDLAWDAVNAVIKENGYRVQAQNPNHGIIEVQVNRFSLQDADCGRLTGIIGSYAAEPEREASAVYNFSVKPKGNEASRVEVIATFDSALRIPLHAVRDVECVSRGVQESRLLREVIAQASITHPPERRKAEPRAREATAVPSQATGRPTLLRPDVIRPDLAPRGSSE